MKIFLRLSLIPLWMIFLAACTRSASAPPTPDTVSTPLSTLGPAYPFPLALSSTWVYEMTAHTEGQTARWRITQTIVIVGGDNGLLTAEVEQTSQQTSAPGSEADQFFTPQDGRFWYILDGQTLYRQNEKLDLEQRAAADILLRWPPESVPCWCVTSADGCIEPADGEIGPGCRHQTRLESVHRTSAGEFSDCRELVRAYNNGAETISFCPNIGIVAERFQHLGSDFGYEMNLIGYSLPTP